MTTFFTADHHIGHHNIIKHSQRPFSKTTDMLDELVRRHNTTVQPKDTVYFLGDFAWSADQGQLFQLLERFNGKKHFILGNHDDPKDMEAMVQLGALESCREVATIKLMDRTIFLSHYPHRSWNRSYHGSWHLFGHCHGMSAPYGRSFDCGVDAWDFRPVSLAEVTKAMEALPERKHETCRELWRGNR